MSVRRLFYLACTNCNNQFTHIDGDHYGETAGEVRMLARENGWLYKKVKNGSMWDFCPRCWRSYQEHKEPRP